MKFPVSTEKKLISDLESTPKKHLFEKEKDMFLIRSQSKVIPK